jgi:tRNA (adenine57-N1/adenine58-N1)-methyltransferase
VYSLKKIDYNEEKFYIILDNKKEFSNSSWTIKVDDLKTHNLWDVISLWKDNYVFVKPTLEDYIMFWLKRKTQIIYPLDATQITTFLGIKKNENVFESWIGSWALSLYLLDRISGNWKLVSFEQNEEFIELATKNIKNWYEWNNLEMPNHEIINANIIESNFDDYKDFFDKWIIDIKDAHLSLANCNKIIKDWGILVVWSTTSNQVEDLLANSVENWFYVDKLYQFTQTEWLRVTKRLRPNDWQVWQRWFIVKLIKTNFIS